MGLFLAGINLHDLAAGAAADIFYPHRHIQRLLCAHIPAEVIFTQFHGKIRVAQAVSERILHSQLALCVAAVAHKHALTVVSVIALAGEVWVGGRVLVTNRERHRQAASRLGQSRQQTRRCHTAHAARNEDAKHCIRVRQPVRHLHRSGNIQQHDGFHAFLLCLLQHLGHAGAVLFLYRHAFAVHIFPSRGSRRVHQRVGIGPFLKGRRAAQFAVFVQHIAVQGRLHRRGAAAILQCIAAARPPEHSTLGLGQR